METKTCKKCCEVKAVSEFHKRASSKDGLRGACKLCINSARDKDKIAADNRMRRSMPGYAERQKVLHLRYREKNRESIRALGRVENLSDEAKANKAARCRTRQAAKLQRTPPWADMSAVAEFYVEAKRLEELTGIQFHVDHIVPLQGEMVSGLHVPANLQLLTAHENLSKSNGFAVAA